MKLLLPVFLLFGLSAGAQICNQNGNIVIFSNYDGGILNINVDVNIPNLKIGIVSYEAVQVNLSGTYVGNITGIEYAGYNDPNGYLYIDCGYSCGSGSQGGCNTAAQIYDYFENVFSGTVYTHETQYGCWSGTQNISDGGNCCAAPPSVPTAEFSLSNSSICVGECIDFTDLSSDSPTSWNWDFTGMNTNTSTLQNPTNICYDAPGVYTVILVATNAMGSDTITHPLVVTAANTNTSVSGITITASANNATYQWINCATNQPIQGATSSSFTPSANGLYAVIVTENGCSDTSACTAITTVGLDQLTPEDLLSIYPNPSSGHFVLVDAHESLLNELVTVYNVFGEVVFSATIADSKTLLDLSAVKNGIYFVSIDSQLGKVVTKIIKQ